MITGEEKASNIAHKILAELDMRDNHYYHDCNEETKLEGQVFNINATVNSLANKPVSNKTKK